MNLIHRAQLRAYLFWAVVIGFILLSALMVMPFVGAIISAYILAFMVRPLFLRLRPRFGHSIAAVLCIAIAIVVVVLPIILVSFEILSQAGDISKGAGSTKLIDAFVAQPFLKQINVDPVGLKAWMVVSLQGMVDSLLQSIPGFGLGLIITVNCMFFLLCRWNELAAHLMKYLPFKNNGKIIAGLGETANSIINGNAIISVIEGVIAFVGFSMVGVQASIIFAVLVFLLAFMPGIGPIFIWLPLALYYFSVGQYATMWGIVIIGLILLVGIEILFYAWYVGGKSAIHPFIMLIGVLGGMAVFGIFGFVIGPLVLANSIKIIEEAVWSDDTGRKKADLPGSDEGGSAVKKSKPMGNLA